MKQTEMYFNELNRKEIKCIQPNEIINIILDNGHISLHRYNDNPSEIILSTKTYRLG